VAPVVIGWEMVEAEPNDVNYEDFDDLELSQDLGMLSGVGFVDILTGALRYDGNEGSWNGDVDSFKFQVEESLVMSFTFDWPGDDVDLDINVFDADGNIVDQGWYGHPEIPEIGPERYEPGQDYYLTLLIWSAPSNAAGDEISWELALEQTP
jgi:hypothetical protein